MKPLYPLSSALEIRAGDGTLNGIMTVPLDPIGTVIFAHGSGSSRFSPRNNFVAQSLNAAGMATLLFDLLTPAEETVDRRTRLLRFDIPLLARRLTATVDWLQESGYLMDVPIGLFGSSTVSAAALIAAALRPNSVQAVVSRGGRPDLASDFLPQIQAPALFIVGEWDRQVLELNIDAARKMTVTPEIKVVPHASHLFEEPGKLQEVAQLASAWLRDKFQTHSRLGSDPPPSPRRPTG